MESQDDEFYKCQPAKASDAKLLQLISSSSGTGECSRLRCSRCICLRVIFSSSLRSQLEGWEQRRGNGHSKRFCSGSQVYMDSEVGKGSWLEREEVLHVPHPDSSKTNSVREHGLFMSQGQWHSSPTDLTWGSVKSHISAWSWDQVLSRMKEVDPARVPAKPRSAETTECVAQWHK